MRPEDDRQELGDALHDAQDECLPVRQRVRVAGTLDQRQDEGARVPLPTPYTSERRTAGSYVDRAPGAAEENGANSPTMPVAALDPHGHVP